MSMLRAFATYPRWGLTDEEAADFCDLDTGMSCWWHRASDLRSMGYIEWLYDNDGILVKRLGKAGRYRGVSRITASGMARAKREGLYDT